MIEQSEAVIDEYEGLRTDQSSDRCNDTSSDSLCDEEDDEAGNLYQKIRKNIEHLLELAPSLQRNLVYARKARADFSQPSVVPFCLSERARPYVSMVRERFQDAQESLVNCLGEVNWQRQEYVRKRANNATLQVEEEAGGVVENTNGPVEKEDYSYSASRPYSSFYDSGIGTSVPTEHQDVVSHKSFQSSNADGEQ